MIDFTYQWGNWEDLRKYNLYIRQEFLDMPKNQAIQNNLDLYRYLVVQSSIY